MSPQLESPAARPAIAAVIETKLAPPRTRRHVVVRHRLLRALDRSGARALTLIAAPAGFGKTVLAQTWCASRPDAAIAWVSLDTADDDATRLWTHVATAIERLRPGL